MLTPALPQPWTARSPGTILRWRTVWLDMTPVVGAIPSVPESWSAQRFYLTAGDLDAVASGIGRAVDAGVTAISLPNLPLFGEVFREAGEATPKMGQLADLACRIAGALHGRPGFDLRVHHYGLWQALRTAGVHPHGEGSPGAGCQAGNALAYIDPAGILYPCASLPVPLAKVGCGAIAEAWSGRASARCATESPESRSLRRLRLRATCRGGCRGWAHYLAGTWNALGPDRE